MGARCAVKGTKYGRGGNWGSQGTEEQIRCGAPGVEGACCA